jgi:hypothetical protein
MASDSRPPSPPEQPRRTYHTTIDLEELTDALNERRRLYAQITELQKRCNEYLFELRALKGDPAADTPSPSFDRAKFASFVEKHQINVLSLQGHLEAYVRTSKESEAISINKDLNEQIDYLTDKLGWQEVVRILREVV